MKSLGGWGLFFSCTIRAASFDSHLALHPSLYCIEFYRFTSLFTQYFHSDFSEDIRDFNACFSLPRPTGCIERGTHSNFFFKARTSCSVRPSCLLAADIVPRFPEVLLSKCSSGISAIPILLSTLTF